MRVRMKSVEEARRWMEVRIKDLPKVSNVQNIYFATDMEYTLCLDDLNLFVKLEWGSQIIKAEVSPVVRGNGHIEPISKFNNYMTVAHMLNNLRLSGELLDEVPMDLAADVAALLMNQGNEKDLEKIINKHKEEEKKDD